MVKWSVSSLLFAIYDCMHPCHITHWALFAISMIYDCMHPCHITTLSHHKLVPNAQAGASPLDHHCSSPSLSCMTCHTCHITHWSQILKWGRPSQIVPPKMHGHRALHLQVLTFLEWSMSSLFFIVSMICDCMHGTLFTSHIGPQCSSSGLEWSIITALRHLYDMWLILSHLTFVPNAQAVVWSGQMVNIVTALRHLHEICLQAPLSHHALVTHWFPMLRQWSGVVKWSILQTSDLMEVC